MPLGLECLFDIEQNRAAASRDGLVDIVAVQDVTEDSSTAWKDPESDINWLRDLLPESVEVGRVLAYGYSYSSVLSLLGDDGPEHVQRLAESLVQDLRANRSLANALRRPIIFICHGLGGVVVKKSLLFSSTRLAPKVEHLYDQYISTFAILFFGTPHGKTNLRNWLALEKRSSLVTKLKSVTRGSGSGHYVNTETCQVPKSVDDDFASLRKQFHLFFFWEELPTELGDRSDWVVSHHSAAPTLDDAEYAGIPATHSQMVKFSSKQSSSYRTVIDAIERYRSKAPEIISQRWKRAEELLRQRRATEAWELGGFGFDAYSSQPFRNRDIQYFDPPCSRISHFIGRQDTVGLISNAFFPHGVATSRGLYRNSFVVFGMGGSGKTQSCSEYAHRAKDQYNAVFTIRAASQKTIQDSYCRIAEIAELEPTEKAGRHFLNKLEGPWLLIIDNADDPAFNLNDLFPTSENAHVLVTTRNPDFRREGTLGSLELGGLKKHDALHLLLLEAGIPEPWDISTTKTGNRITKTLGYLAIALVQAGICIYKEICQLEEYLDFYSESRNKLVQKKRSPPTTEESNDADESLQVYATFDISHQVLLAKRTEPNLDALDLLKVVSFFHFERIPLEIFSRAVANRSKTRTSSSSRTLVDRLKDGLLRRVQAPRPLPRFLRDDCGKLEKFRINRAVAELKSLSLVSSDGRYLSLHPLVYDWARDRLSTMEIPVWASAALNTLLEAVSLPPDGSSEADGEFHRDILPHLAVCLEKHGDPISTETREMGSLDAWVAKLFQPTRLLISRDEIQNAAKCGWVFAERGHFQEAATYLEMTHSALASLLGHEHEKTMTAKLGLAGVYWGLGRLDEAIPLQIRVVQARSRTLGHMHEQTLQAMDHLGKSYWLHGLYQEALDLQQITAELMRSTIGPGHRLYPDTLAALDNLGVTLGAWRRFDESAQIHHEVLKAREKILGQTHLDTLTTKANLAMALLDLKCFEEAESYMTEVYEERQRQLGREHPWTLWALCYLAKVKIELGDLEETEKMLVWGIEAGKRSLNSDDHLGVLMGQGELARVWARQGRLEEAVQLTLETTTKQESSRGDAHPDCVYGALKLAQVYLIKGDRDKALDTCRSGLMKADKRITREHPMGQDLEEMLKVLEDPSSSLSNFERILPDHYAGNLKMEAPVVHHETKDVFLPG